MTVPEGVDLRVIIVDNDPECSARGLVEEQATELGALGELGIRVDYICEPRRGISTARNTAVSAALDGGADHICFIDDDEWPDPNWLSELLSTWEATGADVVTGPVVPVFQEEPPEWVTRDAHFERHRHVHNRPVNYATTSSVLIRSECIRAVDGPFDVEFGMSGGEDTHLFAQLRDSGRKLVWSEKAVVFEAVPPSRMNRRWLLRREYRRGQTLSLSLRRRDWRPTRVLRRLVNAGGQIVVGLARSLIGAVRGRSGWLPGMKQVVFGAGMVSGLLGRRYQEYERVHGT